MNNLKVIIHQGGIVRRLDGPFEICVTRESLLTIRDALNAIDSIDWTYGWISIPAPSKAKNFEEARPWTQ